MARKKRRSRQFKKSSRVINMEEARQQRLQKRQTAREEAERERTASDERRIRRKRALRKKQSFRRIVVMLGFLCASITGIVMLKKEQHEVLKKQEQLKEEKAKLKEDLKNINDKESIEEQAREKLKLVKPGETIYIPDEN